MTEPTKPSNPKDLIGSDKLPLGLVPTVTLAYGALGHLEGHLKYGLVNWREAGVRTSIYTDAMKRHLQKFSDAGEWADKKTRVPHLGSIIACCGIILDAYHAGKLIDDRPLPNEAVSDLIDSLGETVKHLKALFADSNPIHYTIAGPVQRELPWRDVPETELQPMLPGLAGPGPTPPRPSASTAPAVGHAQGLGPLAELLTSLHHKALGPDSTPTSTSDPEYRFAALPAVPPTTSGR